MLLRLLRGMQTSNDVRQHPIVSSKADVVLTLLNDKAFSLSTRLFSA